MLFSFFRTPIFERFFQQDTKRGCCYLKQISSFLDVGNFDAGIIFAFCINTILYQHTFPSTVFKQMTCMNAYSMCNEPNTKTNCVSPYFSGQAHCISFAFAESGWSIAITGTWEPFTLLTARLIISMLWTIIKIVDESSWNSGRIWPSSRAQSLILLHGMMSTLHRVNRSIPTLKFTVTNF